MSLQSMPLEIHEYILFNLDYINIINYCKSYLGFILIYTNQEF